MKATDTGADGPVVVGCGEAGEGGGPLAEAVSGGEAGVASVLPVVGGEVPVPAADIDAGGGLSTHETEGHEERVVGEAHEDGLGVTLLGEVRFGVEGDLVVRGGAEGGGNGWGLGEGAEAGGCGGAGGESEEAAAVELAHGGDATGAWEE